ncbi:unnamed protein product [Rhizoctonia solani]|uniref:EKC/KEOPS complex subunit CGI121 n=1 Tax=Rhizoctonia solani TaxID=456999 RepID=A0A8H3BVL1_9AGAM|nr:kinase domain protein [Rhizoctonia solani]KAF8681655.1 hypothetical protein RHS04_03585 [Rhizoctonia solani]QRW15809.1 kinase domain protein [Rhizoctonia solani]CAE6464780.1 unnamed protein product [Rhizoctonia solani]
MLSSTYKFFPPELSRVHIALFTNVQNASELRSRLIKASTMEGEEGEEEREAVNFAFVDAAPITSLLHLQTAIQQATLASTDGTLRTKTVHSEILWALNNSNNISESIKRFGISDSSKSVFVVRVTSPELSVENILGSMKAAIQGEEVPIEALSEITDWPLVCKYYKVSNDPAVVELTKGSKEESQKFSEEAKAAINEIVVSSVAMKNVMS